MVGRIIPIAPLPNSVMFSRGAEAAARTGNCSPRYVCPLCLVSYFTPDDKSLSREHVPAESLGGKPLLLTCKSCNREAGGKLQGHQVQRERQEAFWRGDGSGKLNFEHHAQGGTVRGEIETSGPVRRFSVQPSRTSPQALESWLSAGQEAGSFSLERNFNWQASRIADLRDAYLWTFAHFGYAMVALPAYDWVRRAIQEVASSNTKWAINLDDEFSSEQQQAFGGPVFLVTHIPECALVVANGSRGIILPTPFCPDPYSTLESSQASLSFLPQSIRVPSEMKLVWDFLPLEAP